MILTDLPNEMILHVNTFLATDRFYFKSTSQRIKQLLESEIFENDVVDRINSAIFNPYHNFKCSLVNYAMVMSELIKNISHQCLSYRLCGNKIYSYMNVSLFDLRIRSFSAIIFRHLLRLDSLEEIIECINDKNDEILSVFIHSITNYNSPLNYISKQVLTHKEQADSIRKYLSRNSELVMNITYMESIQKIPKEINFFLNIRILNLANSDNVILPKEIILLSNLTILNLTNSQIRILPEGLKKLRLLKELLLGRCKIQILPSDFPFLMFQLDILCLPNKELLDQSIGKYTTLPKLEIYYQ